jgi:tetratricopeptide (TPR) repeat protein
MRASNHEAAVDVLKQATTANASDARLWIALGQSLEQHDRPGDAIDAYRNAINAEPQALPAYEAMGKLLEDAGDDRAALACYEQAAEAIGSTPMITLRIAWLHATSTDPTVLNGQNALQLMNMLATAGVMNQPESLHVLAATQARGGMYEQAINSAHRALAGAEIQGKVELVEEIRRSLASYEAGKPYTRPAR